MKSGFISIAGLANAGKSTLINSLVGEKVAIVSWRPQTTRDRILGILNGDGYQIAFVDTPGMHKARNQLGEYMMKSVEVSLKDSDGVIYVIDAGRGVSSEDEKFLNEYTTKINVVVALNKEDAVIRETLFACLEKLGSFPAICAIVPISAKKGKNVDALKNEVVKILPEGVELFPEDMYTDKSMRFMTQEIIREKALYLLDKEIPYGIGVEVIKFELRDDKPIYDICADIVCEKESHKAIIIGKGGSMLKEIATQARIDIEEMVDSKVFLTLFVKVKTDWRQSEYIMKELGYNKKDLK
ncbi:MAG: GTPase Era [Clostridia bacterium]|nr:GTPase Era [Clostridia bacterium]